jgi:predicted MFS family arabinose efflux permease
VTAASHHRAAWRTALGLTLLVGIFPQFALGALAPQLRAELGLDPQYLGLAFGALYLFGVLGSPLAGPIADRVGGRRSCLALLLLAGASLSAASLVQSRIGLLVALLPAGAAMAMANPGTNRWAAAAPTPQGQAILVGVAQAGVQAGALLAGALAAGEAVGLGWRGALRVGAGVAAIGLAVAWWAPADAGSQRKTDLQRPTSISDDQRSVQRQLAAYALLMGGGTSLVFAYLPSFAVDEAGLSTAAAGATAMVFGATALVGRVALGVVLRRNEGLVALLLLSLSLGSAASIVVIGAGAANSSLLWVGTVLFGATGTTWPVVAFLAVLRSTSARTAGRVTGWVTSAFYLGLWLTPPAVGRLIVSGGYRIGWTVAMACYLLAILPVLGGRVSTAARRDA